MPKTQLKIPHPHKGTERGGIWGWHSPQYPCMMLFDDVLDMGVMSGFIDSSPHKGFSSFQWIVVRAIPIGSLADPFPEVDGARHWIVAVIHTRTRTCVISPNRMD